MDAPDSTNYKIDKITTYFLVTYGTQTISGPTTTQSTFDLLRHICKE